MIYERPFLQSWGSVRAFLDQFFPRQFMPRISSVSNDWRVQKLINLTDSDPASIRWNLDQICKQLQLCMSGRQALRLFKTHTTIGIKQYAKKKRLEMAAQQLRATEAPVKAIAVDAGYRHVGNFTRSFLKHFRVSPVEFSTIWRRSDVTAARTAYVAPVTQTALS